MDQAITASEKTVWFFFKWFTEIQMLLSFDLFYSVINNVHGRQTKLGPENLIKLEMKIPEINNNNKLCFDKHVGDLCKKS